MVKTGRLPEPRFVQGVHKLGDENVCPCEVIRRPDAHSPTLFPTSVIYGAQPSAVACGSRVVPHRLQVQHHTVFRVASAISSIDHISYSLFQEMRR
jgi:hypothetical protein